MGRDIIHFPEDERRIDDNMHELVREHAALVRITGDAPCKNTLLADDHGIVKNDRWTTANKVVFDQIAIDTDPRIPDYFKTPFLSIEWTLPSLPAFEGVWKMIREYHDLDAKHVWRIRIVS